MARPHISPTNRRTSPRRRGVRAAVGVLVAALTAVVLAAPAQAATPSPVTPRGLTAAIEQPAYYVGDDSCDPHTRPGTKKLAQLLAHTYARYGASAYNTTYACGTDGSQSEHYDGRAIDWMVDIHNKAQHTAALAFLKWLLATDSAGNRYAMARRLGVMYVIYDNRIWGSWDGQWDPCNGCAKLKSRANDNACHRTHMHISLSWDGAFGRTSYWTKRVVTRTDFGPCRPRDLNWAAGYTRPNYAGCVQYPTVKAPKGASALKKTLVRYSGMAVKLGSTGPVVSAVQQALHLGGGSVFGKSLAAAVRRLQSAVHTAATGVMTPAAWRALLARTK